MDKKSIKRLQVSSSEVRLIILDAIYNTGNGHIGGSLSVVETLVYLYLCHMNVNPSNPSWMNRDRFVLSKGHAAPALYAVLAVSGFFSVSEVKKTLGLLGSRLQGHPSMNYTPGIDMSTGSLGQGISTACGMALSGKLSGSRWRVYTILGDCELQEGQVWEAMMFASHNKLDNLCVIIDNNNYYGIDNNKDDSNYSYYPITNKCRAFGFNVIEIDGHDFEQIEIALEEADQCIGAPTVIIEKTVKGKGISFMEHKSFWHGNIPNTQQYELAISELEECIRRCKDE